MLGIGADCAGHIIEASTDQTDSEVLDSEYDVGMHRVRDPIPGERDWRQGRRARRIGTHGKRSTDNGGDQKRCHDY